MQSVGTPVMEDKWRYQMAEAKKRFDGLPAASKRSIADEYIWSSQVGFGSISNEAIDFRQVESGSIASSRLAIGGGLDADVMVSSAAVSTTLDVLAGFHPNATTSKEQGEEATYQMLVDLPPAMDIRQRDNTGKYAPKPGVVDAYRQMSFYLEADEENGRILFNRVIDPEWLNKSDDPNAIALRSAKETACTRVWRIPTGSLLPRGLSPSRECNCGHPGLARCSIAGTGYTFGLRGLSSRYFHDPRTDQLCYIV